MASRIEDYAVIGDTETVALVDRSGSVDWWCVPALDSGACFAALLGTERNGRWSLRPSDPGAVVRRRYLPDTLVLETEFETSTGVVTLTDFMAPQLANPTLFRCLECRSGRVDMRLDLTVRFDYGSIVPWVTATGDGLTMVAGGDGLRFHSPVRLEGRDRSTTASFSIAEGQQRSFSLAWYDTRQQPPYPLDPLAARVRTEAWWRQWVDRCTYDGEWRDDVVRSLITLKALSYSPTGAIAAAATTSLPEEVGGVRNWDYRYAWLRDSAYTLQALMQVGYVDEARAFAGWLRRALAGDPGDFRIMYGLRGERRLPESELDWLAGYEGSAPVRVGNAASKQFQLDVFGEVLDAMWTAARHGLIEERGYVRDVVPAILDHLERVWDQPDDGIWEVRGGRRHFTESKVMAWVAFDRAVRFVARTGIEAPAVGRWRAVADAIHAEVCARGWSAEKGCFVQSYDSDQLDASLLTLAPVGFLSPDDPRNVATVEAVQRELVVDGLVRRYLPEVSDDGLPGGEGVFLLTTFWLADNLAMMGRLDEARAVFERLRGLRNDVGLLSEEYDVVSGRLLGNFPQAFSHLALVRTAVALSGKPDAAARGR